MPDFVNGLAQGTQFMGPNIGQARDRRQQQDQFNLQRQDARDQQLADEMNARQQQEMAERQMALQELIARLQGQQAEAHASFQQAQLAADERKMAFAEKEAVEERDFRANEALSNRLFRKESLQATKDEGAETRLFQSEEARKTREATAEQRELDRAEESRIRAMDGLMRLRDQAALSNMQHAQELEKLRLQIDAKSAQDLGDGVRNLDGALRTKGIPDAQIRDALRGFVRSHIAGAKVAKALGEKAASTSAFNPASFLTRMADIQRQSQEAAARAPTGVKAIQDAADVLVSGHEALVKELSVGPAGTQKAANAVGNLGQMGLKMLFGKGSEAPPSADADTDAILNGILGGGKSDIVAETDAAIQSDARQAAPEKVAKVLELGYTRAQVNNLWKNLARDYKAFNNTLDELIEANSTNLGKAAFTLGASARGAHGVRKRIEGIMNLQTDSR